MLLFEGLAACRAALSPALAGITRGERSCPLTERKELLIRHGKRTTKDTKVSQRPRSHTGRIQSHCNVLGQVWSRNPRQAELFSHSRFFTSGGKQGSSSPASQYAKPGRSPGDCYESAPCFVGICRDHRFGDGRLRRLFALIQHNHVIFAYQPRNAIVITASNDTKRIRFGNKRRQLRIRHIQRLRIIRRWHIFRRLGARRRRLLVCRHREFIDRRHLWILSHGRRHG